MLKPPLPQNKELVQSSASVFSSKILLHDLDEHKKTLKCVKMIVHVNSVTPYLPRRPRLQTLESSQAFRSESSLMLDLNPQLLVCLDGTPGAVMHVVGCCFKSFIVRFALLCMSHRPKVRLGTLLSLMSGLLLHTSQTSVP